MTAIVTGGVSGLGEACAEQLLERGLQVVAVDLNDERGAAMERKYAGQLRYVKADVADVLVDFVAPLREAVQGYLGDRTELTKILNEGRDRAREIAGGTLGDVYDRVGFLRS